MEDEFIGMIDPDGDMKSGRELIGGRRSPR